MADFPSNHFFKFIPPGFKFNLSIPTSFLRSLNGWKCKKAILRRGRHKWTVHISEGGVFGEGWRKFVEENGVQEMDFIVFKHQGNMLFDFLVFDPSTCERQYPHLLYDDEEKPLTESDTVNTHNLGKKRINNHIQVKEASSKIQKATPNYFISTLKQYTFKKSCLYIPNEFSTSNELRKGEVILRDDKAGRPWKVKLNKHGDNRLYLGCGFRDFRVANGLTEGDAYKFELVEKDKDKPLVLNFSSIGKKAAVKNHNEIKETCSRLNDHVVLDENENSKLPIVNDSHPGKTPTLHDIQVQKKTSSTRYFVSTLKPYSFKRSYLFLPAEFSTTNDLRKGEVILIDDKGRSWKFQLNTSCTKRNQTRFYLIGCGLRDFWVANGLTEGDEYKFELVENDKGKPPIANFSYLGKKPTNSHLQVKEASLTIKKATSPTRCFLSSLKPYSLKRSCLHLPVEFSVSNDLRKGQMILRDDEGRTWKVQLNKSGEKVFYLIGRGLREFLVANGLTEGDAYKFELVENAKNKTPIVNFSNLGKKHGVDKNCYVRGRGWKEFCASNGLKEEL